ncbi:MAG: SURF1 family protein [Caldilineales bacterium]|nr:SURF1 family protein [Caldilineales bacterium]
MYLFKRRWILTTLLVLVAAVVMVRLGFWQLDRLAGKRAYIAASLAEINAEPLSLTGEEMDLDAQAQRYRRATVVGEYDFAHEIVLKSQLYQDRPGFHLLTPFLIDGSSRAILVDRGWVAAEEFDAARLDDYAEQARQTITGRIEPQDRRPQSGELPEVGTLEWYRVDIDALQRQMPYELLPFYIALTPDDAHEGFPIRNPPEIILDEGPHLGYAIQWFLFALVVPIVYGVQVYRMDKRKEAGPETDQADSPPQNQPPDLD